MQRRAGGPCVAAGADGRASTVALGPPPAACREASRAAADAAVEATVDVDAGAAARPVRRMRAVLGTYVEIGVETPHGMPSAPAAAAAERALAAAWAVLDDAQRRWSAHEPGSELSLLNRAPGHRVPVSRATSRLLMLARALTRRSGGRFNCTVGGAQVQRGLLPAHGTAAARLLPIGCADDIELGPGWARLARPVWLTLDGLAKGWAVDRAVDALRRAGAAGGWVNAGGDVRAFGCALLALHRRAADGRVQPLGRLRDAAVATSAARRRPCADLPGWLADAGGAPVAPGVWSVLAPRAWLADALTKVAAASPTADAAAAVAALGGCLVDGLVDAPGDGPGGRADRPRHDVGAGGARAAVIGRAGDGVAA